MGLAQFLAFLCISMVFSAECIRDTNIPASDFKDHGKHEYYGFFFGNFLKKGKFL